MTMIAKMLKRKVSRVTTEAPDLSAVPGAQGGGDPAQQQTQASDAAPPHRGHRDSSEGLHRNGSVSLPLQYRQVIVYKYDFEEFDLGKVFHLSKPGTCFDLVTSRIESSVHADAKVAFS